jgi:hypothetical protein
MLTLWFPDMVLTYFLNDFEMVPVTPIIAGITLVFTFHILLLLLLLLVIVKTHFYCKVKAIPLQALTDPEDSTRLRLSDFKAIGT